jgi:predicted dinucleotide-binding enzyme
MAKKIGILGSGAVGKTLATGFIKHGYEVTIGTRDLAKLAEWKSNNKGQVASFEEAAAYGEIIVLAVKGNAAKEVLAMVGAACLKGKTIIDTTNPIAEDAPVNGVLSFFTSLNTSLMEQLQAQAPEAHLVKAFNSVGNPAMVNIEPLCMLWCIPGFLNNQWTHAFKLLKK